MTQLVSSVMLLVLAGLMTVSSKADVFTLEQEGRNSVIGEPSYVVVREGETLLEIARRFDLGYDELIKANSHVNRWVPAIGEKVVLPTMHILPDAPRQGVVINLAELRLYFYSPVSTSSFPRKVYTYPISIGRMDWKSPLGQTRIIKKEADPAWFPPYSIKAEHLSEGEQLPNMIPGGVPENPLGHFALRLDRPGYLIHGTDEKKEFGIGMRVTHGCIRMYPEDIEQLFGLVSVGTPVNFVDQPVKAGWRGASLYVEVTIPLKEDIEEFEEYSHKVSLEEMLEEILQRAPNVRVESELLRNIIKVGDGIPVKIADSSNGLPPASE